MQRWPGTRREHLESTNKLPEIPSAGVVEYLIPHLFAAGPNAFGMNGIELPLPWSDINHYSWATGNAAEHWEREALRRFSEAYLRGKHEGKSPLSISPLEREGAQWILQL